MSRQSETLARIALFRPLDAAKIRDLDTQCIWRRAARNEWIIDYQEQSTDVFFVVSGTARVKLQSVSGREVLLREINAGEFFGELAAIDNQPRSSGILAITDVVVARMPAAVFRATVRANPDVCDQLLTFLSRQIRALGNRVNEFTTLDAKHRIYAELLRLSRPGAEKPGAEKSRQAVVSPPPAHTELAARVSIRRETVTREIKALERAGLIERRRGSLVLTDPDQLEKMIQQASDAD